MKKIITLFCILLSHTVSSFAETPAADQVTTIATVNGVAITEQEVKHFIAKLSKPVPAEQALQEMINVELLVQDAKNEGLMKDEELVLEIKRNASGLIASYYLRKKLENTNITLEDMKDRYNQQYVAGNQAKEYNANHILLKTEQEAKEVIQQLDDGAEFTDLAKKLSTGPSGVNGGALGWFKSTDMVEPFSQAAMQLSSGQYSKQPVQTQFGWHVIILNETRPVEVPTFESVAKKISSAMAAEEISKIMKQLNDSATIKFIPQ